MEIIITKTVSSIIIVPVLSSSKTKLSLDIEKDSDDNNRESAKNQIDLPDTTYSQVISNEEGSICIESGLKSQDGFVAPIVIPYKFEENDNGASVSKIIDYFRLHFPEKVSVVELDFGDIDVSGKVVTIDGYGLIKR
ncbi:MAG: hypothetical protein FWG98_06305 [Candidatus Cloacimonetes bacterium]|nr:hypothetical protein [Candidatus Cloacimonadota bacterium]